METRRRDGNRSEPLGLAPAVPILRIFSVPKAGEFYLGYLGFTLDWEHRAARDAPLYQQISRSGLRLHLSEHHGDGSPGVALHLPVSGIRELHAELDSRPYPYLNPAVTRTPFGFSLVVIDPFGNQLRFAESLADREHREQINGSAAGQEAVRHEVPRSAAHAPRARRAFGATGVSPSP